MERIVRVVPTLETVLAAVYEEEAAKGIIEREQMLLDAENGDPAAALAYTLVALKAQEAAKAEASSDVEVPGPSPEAEVIFVNNNGIDEKATVLEMFGNVASLRVQGAHPNDVSIKKNIPKGGPGQKLTYYEA